MNTPLPIFSGIILAGGEGRRVGGEDKGLILLDNKPYIEHVIAKINNQVDDVIISANRHIETYETFGKRVITDTTTGFNGPLSGIAACLAHCQHEWVLIVPCDMPYLPDNITRQLFARIETQKIAIATVNRRHQLVMLVHQSVLPSVRQAIKNSQRKLIRWVESQPYCQVNFDDSATNFRNLNTIQK